MTSGNDWINSLLRPYVEVSRGRIDDGDLRQLLNERADRQVEFLLAIRRSLRNDLVPEFLQSLDYETHGRVTNRIFNMCAALKGLAADNWPELFNCPIALGNRYSTTPRLLVVRAILMSHAEWHRSHFHDLHSAIRSKQAILETYGSDEHIETLNRWISTMVIHQHIVRAALKPENREIFVMGDEDAEIEELAGGLRVSIESCWGKESLDEGLLACVAHSLCCECRNSVQPPTDWPETVQQALTILETLKHESPEPKPLLYFEFGRYFLKDQKTKVFLQQAAAAIQGPHSAPLYWFSFPRAPHRNAIHKMIEDFQNRGSVWRESPLKDCEIPTWKFEPEKVPATSETSGSIWQSIARELGNVR